VIEQEREGSDLDVPPSNCQDSHFLSPSFHRALDIIEGRVVQELPHEGPNLSVIPPTSITQCLPPSVLKRDPMSERSPEIVEDVQSLSQGL